MPTNAQKVPLAQSIGLAAQRASESRVQRLGKVLPCSVVSVDGALITVKFEMSAAPQTLPQVQMPLFGPEYIRYPIKAGDKGVAVAADAYIGQMSGMGSGVADWREPPNLGALVFLPIGNKTWSAVDARAVTIYAPNGVVLRDTDSKVTLTLTPTGVAIDLHNNGNITISNGNLHVTGAVIAGYGTGDQVGLQSHVHTQPADSHGDAEAPTAAPTAGT